MQRVKTWLLAATALGCLSAGPVAAEEVKAPIHAMTILNQFARPLEQRETAFDQALREEPRAAGSPTGEVIGEGTVRYGRATITVKNPCPPGTAHYEPPPLPGRRSK
jgi:hypothetical protein